MAFIRTEHEDDIHYIHAIHCEAFGQATEGDLVNTLRHTNYFSPDLSLVATVDDNIVGHILFTRIVIKDDASVYPVLALASLAVKPAFQHQGIGAELIREGLHLAKYGGHKAVLVYGDPKYYSPFGFELASPHAIIPPAGMSSDSFLVNTLGNEHFSLKGNVYYPVEFSSL